MVALSRIPAEWKGRRIFLHVRAARQRCEVYLNEKLVGYSILEELPFSCDLTWLQPGEANRLALRITNPGGQLDWRDGNRLTWGGVTMQRSHGFGGLDRALMLSAHGPVRITDCWALNTPVPKQITAHATLESAIAGPSGAVEFEVLDKEAAPGAGLGKGSIRNSTKKRQCRPRSLRPRRAYGIWTRRISMSFARLGGQRSLTQKRRAVTTIRARSILVFAGLLLTGWEQCTLSLNGRRVRIYTAISWGYWGLNGLFPIPELAEKEVRAAKQLGLNTLNFHRNLGKEDVLRVQDREG